MNIESFAKNLKQNPNATWKSLRTLQTNKVKAMMSTNAWSPWMP